MLDPISGLSNYFYLVLPAIFVNLGFMIAILNKRKKIGIYYVISFSIIVLFIIIYVLILPGTEVSIAKNSQLFLIYSIATLILCGIAFAIGFLLGGHS
jgi:hypothetical protein